MLAMWLTTVSQKLIATGVQFRRAPRTPAHPAIKHLGVNARNNCQKLACKTERTVLVVAHNGLRVGLTTRCFTPFDACPPGSPSPYWSNVVLVYSRAGGLLEDSCDVAHVWRAGLQRLADALGQRHHGNLRAERLLVGGNMNYSSLVSALLPRRPR